MEAAFVRSRASNSVRAIHQGWCKMRLFSVCGSQPDAGFVANALGCCCFYASFHSSVVLGRVVALQGVSCAHMWARNWACQILSVCFIQCCTVNPVLSGQPSVSHPLVHQPCTCAAMVYMVK